MNLHKALYSLGFKRSHQLTPNSINGWKISLEKAEYPKKNIFTFIYIINDRKRIVLNLKDSKFMEIYVEDILTKNTECIEIQIDDQKVRKIPLNISSKRDIIDLLPREVKRNIIISNLVK